MADIASIENRATIARITCGWKKAALPLDKVRRYWRDVHSPAISRREGIWDYRHMQFDPVRTDLFAPVASLSYDAPADAQLMWLSDVRYEDAAALARFDLSPVGEAKAQLLGDIELIVDRSTTYKALDDKAKTFVDKSGIAAPQLSYGKTNFALFLRQRGEEAAFRAATTAMVARWAKTPGVIRVRLSLFEVPDMEAEKKAGYPIKTHPVEQQYQAWIDLVIEDEGIAKSLVTAADAVEISTIHVYPLTALHTFVYSGRPTLAGLRGYPAYEALHNLGGLNQAEPVLLQWMYGPIVQGGPLA